MVLYIFTGYRVLGIVYLDQLLGACHMHISNHDIQIPTVLYSKNYSKSPNCLPLGHLILTLLSDFPDQGHLY